MKGVLFVSFLIIFSFNTGHTTTAFRQNNPWRRAGTTGSNKIYGSCLDSNKNPIKIIDNYSKITSVQQLLDSFNGKAVFIDLWATWCEPCLEEFKFSKPLYNFLNKNKIEIIYVSFDKDAEDSQWRKKIKENNLSGNHIRASKLLRDDITTLIWGAVDAFSIPRYLLFDSTKRLVNNDTSPPSEGVKLFKEIEQALK